MQLHTFHAPHIVLPLGYSRGPSRLLSGRRGGQADVVGMRFQPALLLEHGFARYVENAAVITRPGSPHACASTAVIMLENRIP